jgi:pyruvate ferredoxin oxidoreductase gamma subunit
VAQAAISEGRYAQAFPSFGPERRGAPVMAFTRISDDNPIRIRAEIEEPDIVVVLDPNLLRVVDVTSGLKKGGMAVVNTRKTPKEMKSKLDIEQRVATVNATRVALEILGIPITNTTMLGALVKATGVVKLDSLIEPLQHRFGFLAEKNIQTMKTAYNQAQIEDEG